MRFSIFFLLPMSFFMLLWGLLSSSKEPMGVSEDFRSSNLFVSTSSKILMDGVDTRELLIGKKSLSSADIQNKLRDIDDQIRELEEKKRGYLAMALRHEDQAERLQFEEHWFLEAKRHMELADENRQAASEIQKEIDRLKALRTRILQENGAGDGFEDL